MKPKQKPASITSFDFQEKPVANEKSVLMVEGMLSDPAWELKPENIEVDSNNNKIMVRIWATRDPSLMAAQVLKRFAKEIEITFLHAGSWKIQVNDKNLEVVVE